VLLDAALLALIHLLSLIGHQPALAAAAAEMQHWQKLQLAAAAPNLQAGG
jgi:hypothetical protein